MIPATKADRAGIEALLAPHAERAMFPLSNLAQHGMAVAGVAGHPHCVTMWVSRRGVQISDVLTVTDSGMVMPFLPSGDYGAAARVLAGRRIAGIIGVREWARGLQGALHATAATSLDQTALDQTALDQDEPHFALNLTALQVPDGTGQIVPLGDAPQDVITDWMLDYQRTTLNAPAHLAAQRVAETYGHYIAADSHVVLMQGKTALAMSGFNARLPQIVQVGGVYTPPALRGRGHARRVVALHLAQARAAGVRRATLFAANPSAVRAYRALGFAQIGEWTLCLYEAPTDV